MHKAQSTKHKALESNGTIADIRKTQVIGKNREIDENKIFRANVFVGLLFFFCIGQVDIDLNIVSMSICLLFWTKYEVILLHQYIFSSSNEDSLSIQIVDLWKFRAQIFIKVN